MKKYIILLTLGIFSILPTAFASTQAYTFSRNLSIGSSGNDVSSLQTFLIGNGFDIASLSSGITSKGYFGAQTKNAVVKFQLSVGLPNTGYVGPLTRSKLNGGNVTNNSLTINKIQHTFAKDGTETWTVMASSSQNRKLTYAVNWGDVKETINCDPIPVGYTGGGCPQPQRDTTTLSAFTENPSFTKAYTALGTYTATFVVRDDLGNQVKATTTVEFKDWPGAAVNVTSPNGLESWNINSDHDITWKLNSGFDSSAKVDIYLVSQTYSQGLCVDGESCGPFFGTPEYVLDKNIPNTGTYGWIAGTDVNNKQIPKGSYGIKICIAGKEWCDYSNAPFTLTDQPVTLSVITDKSEYKQDEPIKITLKATNSSNDPITLYFTSGCETYYSIAQFNSNQNRTCTANVPTVTIKAKDSYTWEFTHASSTYLIPVGLQNINVGILAANKNPFNGDSLSYTLPNAVSTKINIK